MNDNTLLRLWFISYYISGILIPLMIIFGFIFNRFNVFNMIFSALACIFQFTMFLGLQLRNHKALFMYSTIFLTVVHICTFIYLIYMTQTLTENIRYDLENDIFTNSTELNYKMQIKLCK
jgi:heme/copper-type cytochrome/quinol oxidase subunit 4